MSNSVYFPPIWDPPVEGRILRVRRMPGHFAKQGDPVVDIQLGHHILTVCAEEDGKVMRCREVGDIISAHEWVFELTGVGTPTWELFIAYRRSDSLAYAGRVADCLFSQLGPAQVFRDIESLEKGPNYVNGVRDRLQRAVVMVVVVGPQWVSEKLHRPDDLHREEIRTALQRGIHIQPVLVGGAEMPSPEQLPDDIRDFAYCNAIPACDLRWEYDMSRVSEAIEPTLAASPRRQAFLAQVPPWTDGPRRQWIEDNPEPHKKTE
jgi:hypothetical protein